MQSRNKLHVSARRSRHVLRQSRAKGTRPNDEDATLLLSEHLTCLRKPSRTYIRGVASTLFIPRRQNRLHSLTSENLLRLLLHIQVAHTGTMYCSVAQNQPYFEYANPSGGESLTPNPCVMEIKHGQHFETRETSASCVIVCCVKQTDAPAETKS